MCTAATVPAWVATCGTSVFITSRMNSTSSGFTLSPGLTRTFQTLPGTWVNTSSVMIASLRKYDPASDDAALGAQFINTSAQVLRFLDRHYLEAQQLGRLRLSEFPECR